MPNNVPEKIQAVWKLESPSTTQKVVLPAGQKAFNHADRAVGIAHRKNNVLCISSACDFSHSLGHKRAVSAPNRADMIWSPDQHPSAATEIVEFFA
jgi:hypothetical protein